MAGPVFENRDQACGRSQKLPNPVRKDPYRLPDALAFDRDHMWALER